MSFAFLPLEEIDFAVPMSCRFERNPAHARRLGEIRLAAFPPVVVFQEVLPDGQSHYRLADGGYRYAVAERQNRLTIQADVRRGNLADAVVYACQANERHGVPRTHADKREAVMRLLGNPLFFGKSDVWISEQCKVSDRFVAKLRQRTGRSSAEREGRDGKTRRVPIASPPRRSSRDEALAELARAKAEIDEAIELVDQASVSEGIPIADILRQLFRAREEILVWEQNLKKSPPEVPVPDPNDGSPEGIWAAEEYRIRRMGPEEFFGMMETFMKASKSKQPLWKDEFDDEDDGLQEDLEAGFEDERDMPPVRAVPPSAPPPVPRPRLDPRQMEAEYVARFVTPFAKEQRRTKRAEIEQQPRTKRAEIEEQPRTKRAAPEESPVAGLPLLPYLPEQPRTKRAGVDPPEEDRGSG